MKNNGPLVSIIVLTYNSSKTINETLDSIKEQDYINIELIISDDNSIDDTIIKCNKWIENNKKRFIRVEIVQSTENKGVSANANQGISLINGEWVKLIAGDDLLFKDAISKYVDFINNRPNVDLLVADYVSFEDNINNINTYKHGKIAFRNLFFGRDATIERQQSIISKTFVGFGPTFFISSKIIKQLGGFDERFPMQEDYPFVINAIYSGYKMYLMQEETVFYRIHGNSICHTKNKKTEIFSPHRKRVICDYKFAYKEEKLNRWWKFLLKISLRLHINVINRGNTKDSILCMCSWYMLRLFDPFCWYVRIAKLSDKVLYIIVK